MVVADGAAFGAEIDKVLQLIYTRKNVALYLPESFEWMILSSGILKSSMVDEILSNPSDYIESKEYFSWERFFTSVLIEKTKDSYMAYAKRKINPVYVEKTMQDAILKQMKKIKLAK